MPTTADLEHLLREDDWIRRIARQLASDPQTAEDLAQDAWVVALGEDARTPDHAASAARSERNRGWLFGVVRNLRRQGARSERRRSERERRAAREEALPSTADLVGELTLRQEVGGALLALEEPYRRVLYLRFYQDLTLQEAAEATGVSASTVHARVADGLARMRRVLDGAHGGERRAWSLGLLSLARPIGSALPVGIGGVGGLGSITMGAGIKIGLAAAAAGVLLWTLGSRGGEATREIASAPPTDSATEALLGPATETPRRNERERLESGEAAETPAAPAALPRISGLVLDTAGRTVPALEVGPRSGTGPRATSDAGGRFELSGASLAPEAELVALSPGTTTLVPGLERGADGRVVVVAGSVDLAGRVVDTNGQAIPGARVELVLSQALFRELSIARPFGQRTSLARTTSDEAGAFALDAVAGGTHLELAVRAAGYASVRLDAPEHDDRTLVATLERIDGIELSGVVVDGSGRPVLGAEVSAGQDRVTTDVEGRFLLLWNPEARGVLSRLVDGVWRQVHISTHLAALKPGLGVVRVDLDEIDPSQALTLRLQDGLTLQGTVRDAGGSPVAGARVWARELTHFCEVGSYELWGTWTVEERLATNGVVAVSDAEGAFLLEHLVDREYELQVIRPERVISGPIVRAPAGATDVVLVLDDVRTAVVAGRLLGLDGRPIVGAEIAPMHRERTDVPGAGEPLLTDSEGAFRFEELALDAVYLECFHDAFFFHAEWLGNHVDGTHGALEIRVPLLCELEVDASRAPDLEADAIRVLGPDEQPLDVLESFGDHATQGRESELEEGRTGVLRVSQEARTLVFLRAGEEVHRRPLELTPDARTLVEL